MIKVALYKGARAVIQGGAQLGTSQKYADASARKAQGVRQSRESAASAKERVGAVEQTIESSGLRGDDGIPPGYPTVTAEAFFHQVDLYWPEPPASDEVVGSLVRIRPEGESSRIVRRPRHSATIKNLPHKPHTFEVLLFDKWGRESLWSDAVSATPMLTAAETIDLGEIAMLGRLRGLLPNTNLATIQDATKLADELISSGKIAPGAVTGPKIPDGAITGPKLPDGAVTGPKVAPGAIAETRIADGAITTPKITAGAVTAGSIAADAITTPKIAANAVEADKVAAGAVTTPKLAAGAVVADKIEANAITAPKILADAIQTRHITAGAVTASVMAAQDAAAFNLWAQNAMIRSAAIQSITADKITAGNMTAGQITIAGGGSVKAGRTMLDSRGLTLPALSQSAESSTFVSENQDYKITDDLGKSALYFRKPFGAGSAHSVLIQGDSAPNQRGMAHMAGIDTPGAWDHPSNAMVRVGSYRPGAGDPSFIEAFGANAGYRGRWWVALTANEGYVNVVAYKGEAELRSENGDANVVSKSGGDVNLYPAQGVIDCNGPLNPVYRGAGGTPPQGGWTTWNHNLGRMPQLVIGWIQRAGEWTPLPTSPSNGGIDVFVSWITPTQVRIRNESSTTFNLGVSVF